jgi:hypothetical protein
VLITQRRRAGTLCEQSGFGQLPVPGDTDPQYERNQAAAFLAARSVIGVLRLGVI